MRIDDRLAAGSDPSFSFEFFPPRTDEGERNLGRALAELSRIDPTFVSVTYGAAGTTDQKRKTIDIVRSVKAQHGLEAMAHFTCVGATVGELRETLDLMRDAGIENVLALRGDPPAGADRVDRHRGRPLLLARADRDDPLRLRLRDRRGLLPGGPHPRRLRRERPALPEGEGRRRGALPDHAAVLRQRAYWDFVARARDLGIDVPIVPGIMPITNFEQIKRFTDMCGATIPHPLLRELGLRADDAGAVADFGVAYATLQCADLLAKGAPGIHFYTLNKSPATRAILSALRALAPWRDAVPA